MTYELAKELKEAGFPQKIRLETGNGWFHDDKLGPIAFPTLSELIEACGEEFSGLTRDASPLTVQLSSWRWMAHHVSDPNIDGTGETAEEAIARLWLALNKK